MLRISAVLGSHLHVYIDAKPIQYYNWILINCDVQIASQQIYLSTMFAISHAPQRNAAQEVEAVA